jgi:TP901 family phage tail tape measure protein
MTKLLKIALELSMVDRLSSPIRKANETLGGLGKTAGLVSGKFGKLANDVDLFLTRAARFRNAGRNVALGGLATGGLLGLGSVPGDAARAEHALRAMGNVGEMTDRQVSRMNSSLLNTTTAVNQMQLELIAGMNTLVAAGLNPEVATRFMPTIGKAATATQSAVDDLSKTLYSVYDNLKVPENQLAQSIDTLTLSGKRGRFELKDMARYFPMLTAGAQSIGMKGVPAVASLGAALQIAMKGAGAPEEAARNFENFLMKITSKETVKNFAKLGVNVEKEMNKATTKGLDPIEHMLNLIMKVTGGNKFKLGEIFGDMQVTNFIVPMMKNLDEYRKIRDETMTVSGVVDKDYKEMMKTTIEQWKLLKVTMAKIAMPNLAGPLSLVNGLLKVMTGNALLTKLTFYGIGAAVTGGGFLFGLGSLVYMLPKVAAGFKMVTAASALLMTMTGSVIAAAVGIGAAGYMIWKNWSTLKQPGFFKDLRNWVRDETLLGQFYQGGVNIINSLWQGMKSIAMKPVDLIKGIAQKIRNHLPFSPAKEGPLRDIHRIRLVETIADSMKPAPMVKAMRAVTAATFVSALPVQATNLSTMTPRQQSTGAHIVVNYSPVINIDGEAARGTGDKFVDLLRKHASELERIIGDINKQQQRRSF